MRLMARSAEGDRAVHRVLSRDNPTVIEPSTGSHGSIRRGPVTTGPFGSHFHQHHRGPGTSPQMFRIVRSRTLNNVLDGGRRRLWHRPTSRYRLIADNSPSASPGRSACIPELPPSASRPAVSRRHRGATSRRQRVGPWVPVIPLIVGPSVAVGDRGPSRGTTCLFEPYRASSPAIRSR
jgi:hypothetical protein